MDWKDEYFKLLGDYDITMDKIDRALSLKVKNYPGFLYKYRAINDFALQNLETDSVWLDKPALYNDPFEFAEYIDFKRVTDSLTEVHYNSLFENVVKDYAVSPELINSAKNAIDPINELTRIMLKAEGRSESEIKDFLNAMEKLMEDRQKKMISEKVATMQEQMKTCSFSESHEQLLMWSHYADHHRGICIEYDLSKWNKGDLRRRSLYPVRYVDKIYDATQHMINSMTKKDFNNLYPLISGASKSREWEYEKEWRIIINVGGSFEAQNYNMLCQSAVYLGHRIEKKSKDKVMEICTRKKIPVFQTILSEKFYKVGFTQL